MKIPRDYQQQAIEYMKDHNTYLCDDCGLGKTLVAINTVIASETQYKKNMVVCPKNSRHQWKEAILEQIPDAEVIITDHLKYKFETIDAWFIIAFDELTPKSLLYYVARVVWNTIIIDEAHRLRNHTTAKAKNITRLIAARKIALSATPIEHHGGELWSMLKWLSPEDFPSYWTWVRKTFETKAGFFGGFDIGDPIDPVSYQSQVIPHVMRRTKQQVAPELPPKIEIPILLEMDPDQKSYYNEVLNAKDVLVQIQDTELLITNALTLFTRLHQIAVLPSLLGVQCSSVKINWLDDWLDDNKNLRVLVFTRYRGVVEHLHQRYNCLRVIQGINESDRFKNSNLQMIAGTIDAMSESLSFEMADAAIFLDQHWSATKMQQAQDRIHRMNITSAKLLYYLNDSDVDTRVMKAVSEKLSEKEMLLSFART